MTVLTIYNLMMMMTDDGRGLDCDPNLDTTLKKERCSGSDCVLSPNILMSKAKKYGITPQ